MKCRKDRTDEILEHLNNIEPDHIRFTKEEEVDGRIAVLDLDLSVNRRTKKIEFGVHYKKTHTNITIKKISNHKESIKRAIIKGYADRARALCDKQNLEAELETLFKSSGRMDTKRRRSKMPWNRKRDKKRKRRIQEG